MTHRRGFALLLALAGPATPLRAQVPCALPAPLAVAADSIRPPDVGPLEILGATAATGLVFLADRPIHDFVRRHRSDELDAIAGVFRRFGTPEVYGVATAGVFGAGVVAGDRDLRRAGARMAASFVISAGTTWILKRLVGRSRPAAGAGALDFEPLGARHPSFPSGHATVAFALATTLSDEIDRTWASVALYTLAAGTAWSRVNDGEHWTGDVVAGALVGVASARFAGGGWTVLGIRSPDWLRPDASDAAASPSALCRMP